MPTMDRGKLGDLIAPIEPRHVEDVRSPMGDGVVFEVDHPNGNRYSIEAKFGGRVYVHERVDGSWEELHSA